MKTFKVLADSTSDLEKKFRDEYDIDYFRMTFTIDDTEYGSVTYEIQKARVSIRLTAPYSEERRKAASEYAKAIGIRHKP